MNTVEAAMRRLNRLQQDRALAAEDKTDTPSAKTNDTNKDTKSDKDNVDDSDDSNDDAADKQFEPTEKIKPLCDAIENVGDQFYVISELIKQVEGYKGENNTDSSNDALAALRSALDDCGNQITAMKTKLSAYLESDKTKG